MPGYEAEEVCQSVETRIVKRPRKIEKRENQTFVIEFTKEEDIQKKFVFEWEEAQGGSL